jgi:hypothetical protein
MDDTEKSPDDALVKACDRYLASKHTVLWGRAFDAHHAGGRREAAEWLAEQIVGVEAVISGSRVEP